ncbi:Two-component response regulator-like APRR7 [Sesamum angolense]|uniref:Two-component response regulator-like APRR7 n=1 Tax=Sesamum angolense TaxID=2727404 RepID=A0AAE1T8M1_9LAMI|nr:Two-component response regulator-like APRR7 [Sesamum angolense]
MRCLFSLTKVYQRFCEKKDNCVSGLLINNVLDLNSNPVSALNVDAANQSEKHGATSGLQGPSSLQVQQQQQQTQGSVVCWERFLHVRSVWVLLVENDDSTRHVVTALLRNCNYEVLEAANGLQEWKVLEDLTNHVDIVLTEVVMPCIPGIGLLCKIMSHKSCKNIPVIMMSSHDSMGLVFKCLSKGAVDFLVRPIRKNELKNLWQHVWRRCHSSSGSRSESGTQTQKYVKSKGSSGNTASDDREVDATKEGHVQKRPDDAEKGNDLETIVHKNVEPKSENSEGQTKPTGREFESTRELANKLDFSNNATDSCKELNVELSLKRLRGEHDTGRSVPDDRYVLRRSEQSAFSRIIDPQIFSKLLMESVVVVPSNGVSNNIDMGSSTNKLPKDKYEATSNLENQPLYNIDESSSKKLVVDAPHCGSTNVLGGPIDGNLRKYSLNKSASGSNHGSNGQNGSSTTVNAVGNNTESDVGQGGKSGSGDANGSGSGNRVDENKLAQ